MISIHDNMRAFERALSDVARSQLPFATALALNDTVVEVRDDWAVQLERRLDRPTPFTKRGTYIRRASKRKLTAEIGFKDIQARYLRRLADGGVRTPKGRAVLIPVGQRLNRYGNMSKGAVARALSNDRVFSGKVNGVAGIYRRPTKSQRKKKGPQLLIAYKDRAEYQQMLDLQRPAHGRARQAFPVNFARRFRAAMASARR